MPHKSPRYLLFFFLQFALFISFLIATPPRLSSSAPFAVLTQRYDNSRTGANLNETVLNTANVNVNQFGKLFARTVDGQTYAQPLFVPNIVIPNKGTHNVVYVATQHNSVYAFDADDPDASAPLWQTSLGTPVAFPNFDIGPAGYYDIQVEVGVTSTPVIDPASNTLYAVAITNETSPACNSGCSYAHRLHALDITTGAEKFGGPVLISGSVSGAPLQVMAARRRSQRSIPVPSKPKDVVTFDSRQQLQRTGLLLSNGVMYMGFGSYGDAAPYSGWVFGYDAQTLQPVSIFNTTPNGTLGGVWQSGQGLAADTSGNIYMMTGNGTYSDTLGNYGDSFVKLNPGGASSSSLTVADWFTPYNQDYLGTNDLDLGSSGPLLIPGTNLILGGGKSGVLYLLNQNNLGRYNGPSGPDNIVQSFSATGGWILGSPVYWANSQGASIYLWPAWDVLQAYSFDGSLFSTTPLALGPMSALYPGGMLSLSANGGDTSSGILWASHGLASSNPGPLKGVLRAYDAFNIGSELWNSTQNPTRDDVGYLAKFNPPMAANGKVYLGTFSNALAVYGLLAPSIAIQPSSQSIVSPNSATLSVVASGQPLLHYQWYKGSSGDTSNPVGSNSSTFVTPPLTSPASFWMRVSNAAGSADSNAAVVTPILSYYFPIIFK